MTGGAALASLWPHAWPDSLRRDVEAAAGDSGFSHVAVLGDDGPVLLVATHALVVWSAQDGARRVAYDQLDVARCGRMRTRWMIDIAPGEDGDPEAGDPSAEQQPDPRPQTAFEVDAKFAERVRELRRRACETRTDHGDGPPAPIPVAAVSPAAADDRQPAAAPLRPAVARAAPLSRQPLATPARAQLPAPVPVPVPSSPAQRRSTPPEVIEHGIAVSVLNPIGYVRIEPRDVLVPATALGSPVAIGTFVAVTGGDEGQRYAEPVSAEPTVTP